MVTTIKSNKKVKERLDPETIKDIAEALEEYEQGKGIEFSQLKKELNLKV